MSDPKNVPEAVSLSMTGGRLGDLSLLVERYFLPRRRTFSTEVYCCDNEFSAFQQKTSLPCSEKPSQARKKLGRFSQQGKTARFVSDGSEFLLRNPPANVLFLSGLFYHYLANERPTVVYVYKRNEEAR